MARSLENPGERIVALVRDAKLPNASMVILYPLVGALVTVLVVVAIFTHHGTPSSTVTATRQAPLVHLGHHPAHTTGARSSSPPTSTVPASTAQESTSVPKAPKAQTTPAQTPTTPVRTLYGSTFAVPDAAYTLIRSTATSELQGAPDSMTVDKHSATSITATAVRATTAGPVDSVTITISEHDGIWLTRGKTS